MNIYSRSTFRPNLFGSSIHKLPQIGNVLPFDDEIDDIGVKDKHEISILECISSQLSRAPESADWAMKAWIQLVESKLGTLTEQDKKCVRVTVVSEVELVMSQSQSQYLSQSQQSVNMAEDLFDEVNCCNL